MSDTPKLLDDGCGNRWEKCDAEDCALAVVHPGRVVCDRCNYWNCVAILSESEE